MPILFALSMETWTILGIIAALLGVAVAIAVPLLIRYLDNRIDVRGSIEMRPMVAGPTREDYPGKTVDGSTRMILMVRIINKGKQAIDLRAVRLRNAQSTRSIDFHNETVPSITLPKDQTFVNEYKFGPPIPHFNNPDQQREIEKTLIEGICKDDSSCLEVVLSDGKEIRFRANKVCNPDFPQWAWHLENLHRYYRQVESKPKQ